MDGVLSLDQRIVRRAQGVDYQTWRAKVEAVAGCLHPVRLSGSWTVQHATSGAVLASKTGHIFAPCGNRREAVCPSCSDRYAADAFHLMHAGVAGGRKDVPVSVTERPRVFATLTAPSFGAVHNRRTSAKGRVMPCGCGGWHHPADPAIGTPLDSGSYDYEGAVLWQAHVGQLWHRFRIALRRKLAHAAGIAIRDFSGLARIEYGKVAEYQRRGLVHFHAVIRVDGTDGVTSASPPWVTAEMLTDAIRAAARSTLLQVGRPDGTVLTLGWGSQVDVRTIRPDAADEVEDHSGQITEQRLAGYVAKYATKGTGKSEAADRPIRSQRHLDHLTLGQHHRRMIQTAWDIGALPRYTDLNLRKWAHMLGFRGHFMTKSKRYSTTFGAIREERRIYRADQALDRLGVTPDEVVIINDWHFGGVGYLDQAERELADGIGQRLRQHTKTDRREAA
jgi:hypothetical protein